MFAVFGEDAYQFGFCGAHGLQKTGGVLVFGCINCNRRLVHLLIPCSCVILKCKFFLDLIFFGKDRNRTFFEFAF